MLEACSSVCFAGFIQSFIPIAIYNLLYFLFAQVSHFGIIVIVICLFCRSKVLPELSVQGGCNLVPIIARILVETPRMV